MNATLDHDGFALVRNVLTAQQCAELAASVGPIGGAGRRGLLNVPSVAATAASPRLIDLVRPHVAGEPFAVRAILFNKSSRANWPVAWHQDLTIAVRERVDMPGFAAWSVKDGVPHVQPPTDVLARMLTLRLHLDDTDDSNGALRVLPATHRLGRLSADEIEDLRSKQTECVCNAKSGDVLLMRPLLLHASGRSNCERERRVLHIEYAAGVLPGDLKWFAAKQCSQHLSEACQ